MKKYTIATLGIIFNVMLITGLIVYAFASDKSKENDKYIEKQYIYIEKTRIKENDIADNDSTNNNDNNDNDSADNDSADNDSTTKKVIIKNSTDNSITTKKVIIKNSANNSNANNSNASNSNASNTKNYTVDYTNTSYCGFCGIELNNNTGICENCRNLRAKLGE